MATNPASGVSFTVKTNGQTLIVAVGTSASSLVQTLYSDAACTASVTTPATITSDTTYYLPLDVANVSHYISCKQPDGSELWGKSQHLGGITIEPLPSRVQVGADLVGLRGLSLAPAGALAQTAPRVGPAWTNASILSTGRLSLVAINLPANLTITSISFLSATTALDTSTNQWFALYDSARALLRQTTDDTSTAWAANTVKTLALSSTFTTTYAGAHYLGINVTATTVPTLHGYTGNVYVNNIPLIISGTSDSSLTATAPPAAAAITRVAGVPYAYVS